MSDRPDERLRLGRELVLERKFAPIERAGISPGVARFRPRAAPGQRNALPAVPEQYHFAEKLDAFTQVFEDRENTRVKDLVDLVLLIERGLGADAELVEAVTRSFAEKERTLHSSPLAAPPPTWTEDYAAMAAAVRLSASDIDSGFELLQSFWQTALTASTPSVPDPNR